MIDLDELEKLAKEATPGPWKFYPSASATGKVIWVGCWDTIENKKFVAAANPQTVLKLIAVARAAKDCKYWVNNYWERDHPELTKALKNLEKPNAVE